MKKLSYSSSGVSINKGNKFVSEIKKIIRKDKNLKKSNIGGFSGQFILDPKIKNQFLSVQPMELEQKLRLPG